MDAECRAVVDHNNELMTRMTGVFERILGGGGGHLHWGYFRRPSADLREAQNALVDQIAGKLELGASARVLDVGCGIGGTTMRLHRTQGLSVVGITNNAVGVERARSRAREAGVHERVTFENADGLDNGFPDDSFDAVVMIEAAYMIPDKERLFRENCRVLRPGGRMVICDNMLARRMTLAEMMAAYRQISALKNTFGEGRYETAEAHRDLALGAGFSRAEVFDLNEWVLPTVDHLLARLESTRGELESSFSAEVVDDFAVAFEYSRRLCELGISTYGMLVADK